MNSPDPLLSVYPDLQVRLRRIYASMLAQHGLQMRCTQGLRSWPEQAELYSQGRTQPGPIVTYSKPGESLHNYACAADSCFFGEDPYLEKYPRGDFYWLEFGRHCRAFGVRWGGDFIHPKDKPHAELTYGLTLEEIRKVYHTGGQMGVFLKFDSVREHPNLDIYIPDKPFETHPV